MLRSLFIAVCTAPYLTEAGNVTDPSGANGVPDTSVGGIAFLDELEGQDLEYEDDLYSTKDRTASSYYDDEDDRFYQEMNAYASAYNDDYLLGDTKDHCKEDELGVNSLKGQACDLRVTGVDMQAAKLHGGVDGVYKLSGCYDHHPKYVRESSPKTEDRVIWYSSFFRDWEISNGTDGGYSPATMLLYQHGDFQEVPGARSVIWHIRANLTTKREDDAGKKAENTTISNFAAISASVTCKDTNLATARPEAPIRPLLTDDEMATKYRATYAMHGSMGDADMTINFSLMFLVIFAGMGVVLAAQYLLQLKRNKTGKAWVQRLEDSRKRRVGHVQ